MADTLVERLTGQAQATAVPAQIHLVMPADTLLGSGPEPAHLDGYGPVPAGTARDLVGQAGAPAWLRRVFTRPGSGELIGMDSRRRLFIPAQQRFIRLRDQLCRTPWCGAPVRHIDHVQPVGEDGETRVHNGQGLCEACNYAKQAPGWQTRAPAAAHDEVIIRTPTGHRYRSRPPDPPGIRRHRSPVELQLENLLAA
ncbi:MAG TPA: HNH endonuclease [Jatrophihabitantaceae bacterium]